MMRFVLLTTLGGVVCLMGLYWSHRRGGDYAGLWQFSWLNGYLALVFWLALQFPDALL